ncbi:hypothetical protein OF83DRAFT_1143802 [Amylostereum chailletii]|nr:hypothetical protein OF83DRAFT_1143802 [Amylostereum chailletii]
MQGSLARHSPVDVSHKFVERRRQSVAFLPMPCDQTSTASTQRNASLSPDDIEQISKVLASTTSSVSQTLVPLIVETVFFGVFTLLIICSTYLIIRRSFRSLPHKVMLFATLVMYAGATISWTSQLYILFTLAKEMNDAQAAASDVLDELQTQRTCLGRAAPTYEGYLKTTEGPLNVCVPTALLTVNIVFSDAIVLWRAWVLHSRGRVVLGVSVALLFATAALSIVDTRDACASLSLRQLFTGNVYGAAAFLLSWTTNVWATSLIAMKAWRYRRFIVRHLDGGSTHTRMENVMALLVESGLLYCLFWTFLVVLQFVNTFGSPASSNFRAVGKRFNNTSALIVKGGLVQLIGIYPTLVIVAICLKRTPCDRYFTQDMSRPMPIAPEVPLRNVVVTVGSTGSDSNMERGTFVTESDRVYGKAIVGKDEVEQSPSRVSSSV